MADFSSIVVQHNTGSDLVPVWNAGDQSLGGVAGANEMRFCASGAGSAVTAANWPNTILTGSTQFLPEAWGIVTDNGITATGYKIATYAALSSNIPPFSLMARWGWTPDGTFASAPKFTAYTNSTHTNPVPGIQPPAANNDTVTNGSTETSNTSYLKIQAYGYGVDTSGNQQTPGVGSLTTPVTVTDGTAGAVIPATNAWIPTHWQSAQGGIQYIQNAVTPNWTTHTGTSITYFWYWHCALFIGPGMTAGSGITWGFTFSYSFT